MPKKKTFSKGDLVKVDEKHGIVVKFLHTFPIVKAHRTGNNVRNVYQVLLSDGDLRSVSQDEMSRVEDA